MTHHWHESGAAAQYVAGTLNADAMDAFDEHLLECEQCRHEVRMGAAARAAMVGAPASGSVVPGQRAVRSPAPSHAIRRRGLMGLGLAAAAVLVFALVRRESSFQRLGAVTPPPFVGGAVRSSADSTVGLVDRGMTAYANGEFATAADWLERAGRTDSSAGVAFYLGVSRLMIGDAERAVAALLRARQPADNPYAAEALLFAAKALVRQRRVDSALALLRNAPRDGPVAAHLRAFADTIGRR